MLKFFIIVTVPINEIVNEKVQYICNLERTAVFYVHSISKFDYIYPIHELQKEGLKRDFQIGSLMDGKLEIY